MKKIISVMLVISMVLSLALPVSAEEDDKIHIVGSEQTSISAKEYYSYNGQTSVSPMYTGNSFTYKLSFSKSGVYKVSCKNIHFYDNGGAKISVNGRVALTASVPNSNSASQITELGEITVLSGEVLLTYTHLTSSGIYLSSLIFERVGDAEEFIIYGNDAAYVSEGVTDGTPSTGMNANSYADYTLVSDSGTATYGIYATVASNSEASLIAAIDSEHTLEAAFDDKGWDTFEEIYVGSVKLENGTHNLRMTAGSALRLKQIRIRVVDEELEKSFLDDMESASNHSEIRAVLQKYDGKMIIPYNEYINKMCYRNVFDSYLVSLPYDTLLETDSKFLALLETELANPLITFVQNGQDVTELSSGDFTVNIAARFEEDLTAIAALYTDDGMQLEDYAATPVRANKTASITGLSANRDNPNFKIFFIENTSTLRPVELPAVMQTQIFVSPDGDDSRTGLPSAPLATVEGAIERVNELNAERKRDITIFLENGEYVLKDTIELDEAFNSHDEFGVHFKSVDPERPAVISGGYEVKGWQDTDGDGIYTAQLPDTIMDVRQLYIDEEPAQRARSSKYFLGENRWDNEVTTEYTEDGFDLYNSSFPKLIKPEDAELAYLILWTVQRLPVNDIEYEEDNRIVIKMQQPYYSNAITMVCDGGIQPTLGHKFIVENDLALLDEKGEFYFDKDTRIIYYMPFEEEDLSTARTIVAKTEQLITMAGSSDESKIKNITFDDIKFRYGGYYTKVNEEGAVSFQAENLANAESGLGHNPVSAGKGRTLETQITVENAEGIEFNNCDISCMGSSALRLGTAVTDSSVTGCVFADIGGGALSVGTWDASKTIEEGIQISNNVITRTGLDFMFCPALTIYYAKNVDVLHNTIAHTSYGGISVGWGWAYDYGTKYRTDENGEYVLDDNGDKIVEKDYTKPSTANRLGVGGHNISYNRIYDISKTVVDSGHIYNLGYMTESHITNNYLTDSPDFGGVYLDSGASNVKIRSNVFERCTYDNIAFGGSSFVVGNVAENNWADKSQTRTTSWSGDGCSLTIPTEVSDGNWPQAARDVMTNSGVESEYLTNLDVLSVPEWRTIDHHAYPKEEALEPGVVYVNAGELHDYYIKTGDAGNKTKPALFTFSGTTGVGDFRQGEWSQYKVEIPEAGEYSFALQYSRGGEGNVNVYLGKEVLGDEYDVWTDYKDKTDVPGLIFHNYQLPATNTASTGYIPHVFKDSDGIGIKELTLEKGTYYLRLLNLGYGFSYSRFKFTPISDGE